MIEDSKTTIVGFVSVEPVGTLEETASLICEVISGLILTKDNSGYYEEFPAFTGTLLGLKFALLGSPETGKDFKNFELNVSTQNKESDKWYDISEHLCVLLNESKKLKCKILK